MVGTGAQLNMCYNAVDRHVDAGGLFRKSLAPVFSDMRGDSHFICNTSCAAKFRKRTFTSLRSSLREHGPVPGRRAVFCLTQIPLTFKCGASFTWRQHDSKVTETARQSFTIHLLRVPPGHCWDGKLKGRSPAS